MKLAFFINKTIFLALILLNCVSSLENSSMQLSQSYNELLKNKKPRHDWWSRCHSIKDNPKRENIELKYSFSCNSSQTIKQNEEDHIFKASTNIQDEEQLTYIDVLLVIQEQIFNLLYESIQEILQIINIEKKLSHPIVYQDNFASLNSGALILRKSSNLIHSAQSILEDSSDHYLYTDALLPIEIIIALKQEMTINRIKIKSSQIYSSTIKDFILEGAFAIDIDNDDDDPKLKHWFKLLETRAKNNVHEQEFWIANRVIRFLKLTILTKYGDWKYFTMTQIKVYGKGLFVQAMTDFQQTHQSNDNQLVESNSITLQQRLGEIYKMAYTDTSKKPDQNMLTFLIQKVENLSKVQQHQIIYMNNLTDQINMLKYQKQEKQKIIFNMTQKLQNLININEKIVKQSKANKKSLEYHAYFRNQIETIKQKKIEIAVAEQILAKNRLFEQNLYLIVVIIIINACLSALIICICFKYCFKKNYNQRAENQK